MADTVETAANTVIGALISVPMIRANQNGERPDLPYATYQVITRTTQGRDEFAFVDNNGIGVLHGVRQGTVSVSVFGDNCREICDDLVNVTRKPTARYLMRENNFVIYNTNGVRDVSGLRDDASFEQMAVVDFTFRYTAEYKDDVGIIETVDTSVSNVGDVDASQIIHLN